MVLSIDEKTQIQALDRTQPLLPIDFDATEKRTHDYVRHGTTNLFAALNVGTGGTFTSVKVLIKQIRDYMTHWNTTAKPLAWIATADEILAKVRLVQTNIKKLVDNNAK